MISLEKRLSDIERKKTLFDEMEPDNHRARFNFAMLVVTYIANTCIQNLERADCRRFCEDQELALWVKHLLAVPGSRLHPHKFALEPVVLLGCGRELAISLLEGMTEANQVSEEFAVRCYLNGRLAQLTGNSWQLNEPKRKLPFLMPYLRLIEAACDGDIRSGLISDVDQAFSDRMRATVEEDSGLYASKEIPIKWDHLKAAILHER